MHKKANSNSRKNVYYGILLLGIVSLMGDIVYEGSRGIVPSYLGFLGATEIIVGIVGGLGEFLGHAMRLVSGFLADTTRAYWLFIFLGYGLIVSIPLLGIPLGLGAAIVLILLERIGKALRAPSRDTVLSIVSRDVGVGKAFGIHELLDQIGGILGPLIVTSLMFFTNNYNLTLGLLFVPFLALLLFLTYTYKRISSKTIITEPKRVAEEKGKLTKPFYVYTFAVLLNTVGLIPFTLILFKASEILPLTEQWIVPLIYLLIQGVDAPMALVSGYTYDKYGIRVLVLPFLLSIFSSLLALVSADLTMIVASAVVFGLVLGMQESIYRAAVSSLTPVSSRGTAYGIFNTTYGVGFLISGAVFGLLMNFRLNFALIVLYVFPIQIVAVASLLRIRLKAEKQKM